ncbi:hypothetical protein ACVW0P_001434 [Mucilaginibacter sp. UYNi724]
MSKKKLKDLTVDAIVLRGGLINEVILLEKIIDNWLAKYFCNNEKRKNEFFDLILCHDRLTYSSKVAVFVFIIQSHCKDFLKTYPYLAKDLNEIAEKRNILAHWLLDTSDTGIDKGEIHFIKAKKVFPSIAFTAADIEKTLTNIEKYKKVIYNLVTPPLE